MSLESSAARYRSLLNDLGKRTLSALFPNDFEFYMVALELTDSNGFPIDYFVFPIMPSQISYDSNSLVNIKKSAGGITTINSPTFVPKTIQLSGNFGRRFKFLLGSNTVNFNGFVKSVSNGSFSVKNVLSAAKKIKVNVFDSQIKTGYGCIKVLEAIYEKSKGLDDNGGPLRLYFYNPTFGHNFLVEGMSLSINQNEGSDNMIHKYILVLKGIAPLEELETFSKKSLVFSMGADFVNKRLSKITANLRRTIF